MSKLLEQLADLEVPPPPAQFDTQLHERVNRSLVTWQLVDLVVSALPNALMHFSRAFVGFIAFTLSGQYEAKKRNRRQ